MVLGYQDVYKKIQKPRFRRILQKGRFFKPSLEIFYRTDTVLNKILSIYKYKTYG